MANEVRLVDAYVIAKAGEKVFREAARELGGEVADEIAGLYESHGVRQETCQLGGLDVKVTLKRGRTRLDGFGGPFLDFMEARGMTVRAVRDEWRNMVDLAEDGRVVWRETGEVVPGASWSVDNEYVAASGLSDPQAVIADAMARGLVGSAVPLLEGGPDGVR